MKKFVFVIFIILAFFTSLDVYADRLPNVMTIFGMSNLLGAIIAGSTMRGKQNATIYESIGASIFTNFILLSSPYFKYVEEEGETDEYKMAYNGYILEQYGPTFSKKDFLEF